MTLIRAPFQPKAVQNVPAVEDFLRQVYWQVVVVIRSLEAYARVLSGKGEEPPSDGDLVLKHSPHFLNEGLSPLGTERLLFVKESIAGDSEQALIGDTSKVQLCCLGETEFGSRIGDLIKRSFSDGLCQLRKSLLPATCHLGELLREDICRVRPPPPPHIIVGEADHCGRVTRWGSVKKI